MTVRKKVAAGPPKGLRMSVFVWWKVLAAAAAVHLLGPRLAWAGGSGEVGGGGPELADVYEETLTLRPLPDARTVATFRFAVDSPYSRGDHFDVFRVPFICRYSTDTVTEMGRHFDAHGVLSLAIPLNDN